MTDPIVRHSDELAQIVAGDLCHLTELFNPAVEELPLSYSIAYAYVEPGGKTLNHYLEQTEVYYIISGKGTMFLNDQPHPIRAGSCYMIPPKTEQWLRNDGESRVEFLVMVEPPWTAEGETILEEDEE